jgi:alpha-1,3-mannosyltransferase
VYSALRAATGGAVRPAQWVFAGVYLATQACALALAITSRLVPPAALPLLAASKRLHSIYVLRCFNDGLQALAGLVGTLLLARGAWVAAVVVFSAAVSIKMSALLAAPPVALVLIQGATPRVFGAAVAAGVALQVGLAAPFLTTFPAAYASRAFEFSRAFFFKWSVNWAFLPEPLFLSKPFAVALMVGHLATLAWFAHARWAAADGGLPSALAAWWASSSRKAARPALAPAHVAVTVAVGNFVGIVFARSLHYQVGGERGKEGKGGVGG